MATRKRGGTRKKILIILAVLMAIGGVMLYKAYAGLYAPNVKLDKDKKAYIYIRSGDQFADVMKTIRESGYIKNYNTFEFFALKKEYDKKVKPGKYLISRGMSNNELINMLKAGNQVPVRLTLNLEQNMPEIAGVLSRNLEPDSAELLALLTNEDTARYYGFEKETFIAMFVPNTYEFYWATPSRKVLGRFADEYRKFWNEERRARAKAMDMDPTEVATLASIVMKETVKMADSRKIAGVYINRIKMGMALQADPTLKYAANDFTITRVLNVHKQIDSPYNTYIYRGLPPGPICMASGPFIDAVLNYEQHKYLYFCAKEDFSGYSNFAETYDQHQVNARRYQKALDARGIMN
jgi:UPF0755 protein